ncbi:MAG: MiaB/RimO family radical SAM methylthiotransferase, partial [Clostridia bacterium]
MSTIACCTLGCKVNQYDSQAMMEIFTRAGYEVVPFAAQADVYLINTCTVTGTGDHKSMQMIRRAARRNPSADLVVTGCMAQHAAESLRQLPGVRLVLGTQRRAQVLELLRQAQALHTQIVAVEPLTYAGYETLQVTASEGHTRATLKIQEGCDRHCTYCIIPTVRGPIRSRPLQDVRREAERLAQAGFEELVLTGIHLASYGRDFEDGTTLYAAMEAVHAVEGVRRIRLGSLEPRIVDETFAHAMAKLPKVCPHFTLALQSGSDTVLARMARRYNTTQYAQ